MIQRHARTGQRYTASTKHNGRWFVQHSWLSFEDCERKIKADIERLERSDA